MRGVRIVKWHQISNDIMVERSFKVGRKAKMAEVTDTHRIGSISIPNQSIFMSLRREQGCPE